MTEIEAKVVAAWRQAAEDLGFDFTSPYVATANDGSQFEALGLVRAFGGRKGTLIYAGDLRPRGAEGYGVSYLGNEYARYDRQLWIEMLDDWGFWGDSSVAPAWYSPGPHCHLENKPQKG